MSSRCATVRGGRGAAKQFRGRHETCATVSRQLATCRRRTLLTSDRFDLSAVHLALRTVDRLLAMLSSPCRNACASAARIPSGSVAVITMAKPPSIA